MSNCSAINTLGRETQEAEQERSMRKKLIPSTAHSIKLDTIMHPIAQQIIIDIQEGKCIKEMGLRCVIESRVATAGMLMHKNPCGRDNRARECSPHRSQEQVEFLKELATLIAARTTRGRPGQASVAVQQCMTQFRLYSDSQDRQAHKDFLEEHRAL